MTQAYNLSQLANNLTSTGLLDAADGLVNALPIVNGGTGATTASAARTNLGVAAAAFAVPSGGIIMWSGSIGSIPSGWFICDGANGTPDLRNRFLVGAGSTYAVGASGGSANAIVVAHTHTGSTSVESNNHTHSFATDPAGTHVHGYVRPFDIGGGWEAGSGRSYGNDNTSPEGQHVHGGTTYGVSANHTHTLTINSEGSSGTNANLPPYYALAYIMKS
jgi:hypothetical protein